MQLSRRYRRRSDLLFVRRADLSALNVRPPNRGVTLTSQCGGMARSNMGAFSDVARPSAPVCCLYLDESDASNRAGQVKKL